MKEKEDKQRQPPEEETSEQLSIEELMDVQGGIEADENENEPCGLGCYIGIGASEI
jgi:hypothetical protein